MEILGFGAGPYKTNTYVVANGTRAFVVDPGMHAMRRVLDLAKEHELSFEAIVLTHGHIDHTREAGDLAARLQIPVYIHPEDAFMLDKGAGVSPQSQVLFDGEHMTPITDLRDLPGEGEIELIGGSFGLAHAPGHSPGCTIIVGEDFALTGDVLFRGSIGRTDLEHSDPEAMATSLRGPVWNLADKLSILPGHGPTSTMRMERATNPFLRSIGKVI
ncbi:MBL fold metallo-hydrolase [Corynebacterium flavescens]|uniref:MBL fold metallo-hydrolase n=1 Tax=Corynebacterium flavescens TaxID=28028 RepID=UPI003FD01055